MANMTLAVPEELRKDMEAFPEINWSEIARQAIKQYVEMLKTFRKLQKKSTAAMTEEEVEQLAVAMVKEGRARSREEQFGSSSIRTSSSRRSSRKA